MLSRKHYKLIAEAISNTPIDPVDRAILLSNLIPGLKADNQAFNRDRFIDACQPKDTPTPRMVNS